MKVRLSKYTNFEYLINAEHRLYLAMNKTFKIYDKIESKKTVF